ncbi:MAG: Xaa-Pro aminopeptidase [Gammaproteobacteria bacterium]
MMKTTEFAKRRKQLMQKIGPQAILIIPAAPIAQRNGDYDYAYRQNSDFYYLTGFEEPESVAILAPKRKQGEFVLFNRPRDRDAEIWNGYRAGQEGARKLFGANEAFQIAELESKLPAFLEDRTEIHYALGMNKAFDKIILNAIKSVRAKIRNGLRAPITFVDITDTLHEMRLIKSPAEIAIMRKAADISVDAHMSAIQTCKPGMNEYELEAELQYVFNRNGARFPAYTSIVGSGANSCILHYDSNNQVIQDGSLVLIDAGCEYQNYASDITRTFPANGKFSPEQRAIYELVLTAQLAGIKKIRPGASWDTIQTIMVKIITKGLLDLGLLKGKLNDLIKNQAYFKFYMHKSGHWLGLDVHDVGRYKEKGKWRKLKPGMVLTVEPGIYISADIPGVPKRWHNIGVRIEDDVLVTSKGHEVLSEALPKSVEDIEAIMQ